MGCSRLRTAVRSSTGDFCARRGRDTPGAGSITDAARGRAPRGRSRDRSSDSPISGRSVVRIATGLTVIFDIKVPFHERPHIMLWSPLRQRLHQLFVIGQLERLHDGILVSKDFCIYRRALGHLGTH